jgi:1-acyl-sn-glycerol-3-phosphate acyltransferase
MLRPLYLLAFKLFGWSVLGRFPKELKKYVVAVAPHTSNWDFVVGVASRSILRMQQTKFLGKSQLFRRPYGWFFRWLGGYPVDRSQHQDMVEQAAGFFATHESFILAMAPEGTRKKVEKLHSGFYYIAKKANVPIFPVGFDFQRRKVIIGEPLLPGDNYENDLALLMAFYQGIKGKNPALGIS